MVEKAADATARATPISVARRVRGLSDRAIAWLFIAPAIILLLAINIFPLIWAIYLVHELSCQPPECACSERRI